MTTMTNENSPLVLQMLLEEIKQARVTQAAHQLETREEFRRIHAKIDKLGEDVRSEVKEHDRSIIELTTKASMAGRIAGFIAGTVSSLLVYGVVAVFQWFLENRV